MGSGPGAHENVLIKKKKQICNNKLSLDYICLYTNVVLKYNFYLFSRWMKGLIKAKVPRTHESRTAALIRRENSWMDQHGSKWTKANVFCNKKSLNLALN